MPVLIEDCTVGRMKWTIASVHRRRRELAAKSMRLVQKVVANRQSLSAQREVTRALIPFFVEQGRSMASRMGKVSTVPNSASVLVKRIFKPEEWRSELTNRLLPVLARKMAEAGVAHLMTLGVDVRRKRNRRKATKATTAADWAEENMADWDSLVEAFGISGLPLGVMNEIPVWMQKGIAKRLSESFAEDYWDSVSKTTMGDAERVLRQGLSEGWSIDDMAKQLRQYFEEGGFRYARRRSENIARTESGNALNGARKDSVSQLQRELGSRVPMKQAWLSMLGITTRDTHANPDGVPEDERGMWNLSGYEIPWPGHISLPAEERCNCFPSGVLVSGDFVGAQRAWYEGSFAKIVTRNGTVLTLTANHPVVTSKGLVAASMIQPGDQVFSYSFERNGTPSLSPVFAESSAGGIAFGERSIGSSFDAREEKARVSGISLSSGGNQIYHEPAPIEKVFETLAEVAGVETRRAGVGDFYGDGESIQSDVQVVRTDRILAKDFEAGTFEKQCYFGFTFRRSAAEILCLEFPLGSQHELLHRSFHAPSGDPSFAKPSFSCFRSIPGVSPSGSLAVGVAADFDSNLSESACQDGPAVSGFLRDSLERHAGRIAFDEVVEIGNFYSAGHVYDLQSRWGLIVASDPLYTGNRFSPRGIVCSNCHCSLTIEFGMDAADARQEIEEYWQRVEEWEQKGYVWPWQKYDPSQPRDEQGRFGSGGGGEEGGSEYRESYLDRIEG
ncbi:MAG: hypothetical protein V2A73_10040, partial [Pseudomonadota bacterium]